MLYEQIVVWISSYTKIKRDNKIMDKKVRPNYLTFLYERPTNIDWLIKFLHFKSHKKKFTVETYDGWSIYINLLARQKRFYTRGTKRGTL